MEIKGIFYEFELKKNQILIYTGLFNKSLIKQKKQSHIMNHTWTDPPDPRAMADLPTIVRQKYSLFVSLFKLRISPFLP